MRLSNPVSHALPSGISSLSGEMADGKSEVSVFERASPSATMMSRPAALARQTNSQSAVDFPPPPLPRPTARTGECWVSGSRNLTVSRGIVFVLVAERAAKRVPCELGDQT